MKIHEATENIERKRAKARLDEITYQDIERKYHSYDTLTEVIQNRYKGFKGSTFSVRTSKELETTLRIYSEANNIPIAESIKNIVEDYFKDKFVARTFFRLDKPFTVAVPMIPYEIEKYIEDKIDCRIDITSDINDRLAVQRQIISNDDTDYYLAVTFNVGNNYLDIHNEKDNNYYYGNLFDHRGLFDVYMEHLDESIFILIDYENKSPTSARIISKDEAYEMAEIAQNEMLLEYLQSIEQNNEVIDFKHSIADREIYIKTLEARINSLETEINSLKENIDTEKKYLIADNKYLRQRLDEMDDVFSKIEQDDINDDTKQDTNEDTQYSNPFISPETQKALTDAMMQVMKVSAQYQQAIKPLKDLMLQRELQIRKLKKSDNDDSND